MAKRIFELPECRGKFQVRGIVNGIEKDRFYTDKKTKTGKDFRAVNFGCEYNDKQTIFMNLNGMPQQKVYFSKRNQDTGKTDVKDVPWANRYKFNEDGWRMIGVGLGLTKTAGKDGKAVNDKKTMAPFDACEYIKANLKDGMSTFIRGAIDFSSYTDDKGIHRSIKYIPNQISLCKEVEFDKYDDEKNKPIHAFTQTIVYTGIEKEKENDKTTGRFVVTAKIVTYSDIVDTQFIIIDPKLADLFRKKLKPYNAISVHGRIEVIHSVQEEENDDDCWGEANSMNAVNAPTKTEMIITGATGSSIDRETYSEKNIADAIKQIKISKTAEQNFSGGTDESEEEDDWGEADTDDGEEPW